MRSRVLGLTIIAILLAVAPPATVWAQFTSENVGFNGSFGDPIQDEEMFQRPEASGTTDEYIVPNVTGRDFNAAYREQAILSEGNAGLFVFFDWVDTTSPDAWLRLTTFNGADRPNPALDVNGLVRFKIGVGQSSLHGPIGLCIGIRETGVATPQLWDGGVSGDIEWVGVDTSSVTAIHGGENAEIESTLGGDDRVVVVDPDTPGAFEAISWGPNGVFESTLGGDDDVEIRGAFVGTNGIRGPIPVLFLPRSPAMKQIVFNLETGAVSVDETPQGGGIVGFTGDGDLSTDNGWGVFEHIAVTNISTDPKEKVVFGIDELQFEGSLPDPVPAPIVVSPIIAGDEEVTVTNLLYHVDEVTLYINGEEAETGTGMPGQDIVINLSSPAVEGDVYTATQSTDQSGSTVTSEQSAGVTVLSAAPPVTFSILLDEGGTGSCDYTTGGWEWVGVTDVSGWVPQGAALFQNEGVWQTIDVPLNDDDYVIAGLGGDGSIEPSPAEDHAYTMDSIWFTIDPEADSNGLGPWEVFVDAVQVLDDFGEPTAAILSIEDDTNRFQYPRGQSSATPTSSTISTLAAYDGSHSHRFEWTYSEADPGQTLGMLQRIGYTCATSARVPDTSSAIRFHLLLRRVSDNVVPLPEVAGPIIVGTQDSVRVYNDADASSVQLYVNGTATGDPVTPSGTETDFTALTLVPGDSISAVQTVEGQDSELAYPKVVSDVVLPPSLAPPILPGVTTVTVNNVVFAPFAEADPVEVYVNGSPWGSAAATGASTEVTGPTELVNGDEVTARQTVNGITSEFSDPVTVEFLAPVLYKAPAAGDTEVKVLLVYGSATVTVVLRDEGGAEVDTFTGTPEGDEGYALVPVSGLVAGYTITAYQTVGGDNSPESASETVTVGTATDVFQDDMESYVDQDDFENDVDPSPEPRDRGWWPSSGDPGLFLVDDKNFTIGGSQSAYCPLGQSPPEGGWTDGWQSNHDFSYRATPIDPVGSTLTEPIVYSVAIYDTQGAGADDLRQWSEMRDYHSGGLGGLIAVGMPGSSFFTGIDNDYYQARVLYGGPNYINLDQYEAPTRTIGWHVFTAVVKPTSIDFYIDKKLAYKGAPRNDIVYDNMYMGSGYEPLFDAWYDNFWVRTGKVEFDEGEEQVPPPPTLDSAVEEGDTTVAVEDVASGVTEVVVYAGAEQIGTADPEGAATVDVPVTPLVYGDVITATQANAVGASDPSNEIEVGKGVGDILVCIGVRDETSAIEWIGASMAVDGAPQGTPISPSEAWQTLEFDPLSDPILGFTGDSVLDGTVGILEHLAVVVNAGSADRSGGIYNAYVDNVISVGAGEGGADVIIADFDGFDDGDEVLFQEPTYSGSTYPANLVSSPSASATTSGFGNPGKSQWLRWFWRDTTAQRWARITTFQAQHVATPEIDLTKPIRLDILLTNATPAPPVPDLVEAYAAGVHDASGLYPGGIIEFPIDFTNGLVESREQGVGETWLKLVFDGNVQASDFDIQITPDPGVGYALAAGAASDQLIVEFDASVPTGDYTVALTEAGGGRAGGTLRICYSQGDVNCSGNTTGLDLAAMQSPSSWNKDLSDPLVNRRADVNRDGQVTALDSAKAQSPQFWNKPVVPLECTCN